MAKTKILKTEVLKSKIEDVDVFVSIIKAKDLVKIGYIAERGIKEEKAAVQRIFSQKRVNDIADFVSKGGGFFSPFILNWNNETPLRFSSGKIQIPLLPQSAQLLDGQHRFRGIQQAMEAKKNKGDENVVVILTNNLETKDAANIFTNINSKQQSVSKSLIYDLFKELNKDPNHKINRATDIASALDTLEESPYLGRVNFPGKNSKGTLQLSTIVDSLTTHLGENGSFENKNLRSLQIQTKTILNFFNAIRIPYQELGLWDQKTKNPFLGSAGFRAGIEVLTTVVLDKAAHESSITKEFFRKTLQLKPTGILLKDQGNFKDLSGKEQVVYIVNFLTKSIQQDVPDESEYDI